jgi:hypothetical protein
LPLPETPMTMRASLSGKLFGEIDIEGALEEVRV